MENNFEGPDGPEITDDDVPPDYVAPDYFTAPPTRADRELPRIALGVDEHRVTDEAIEALKDAPNVFYRGDNLVGIVRGVSAPKGWKRAKNSPFITLIEEARLREELGRVARFTVISESKDEEGNPIKKKRNTPPPPWLVKSLIARKEWEGMRRLEGVSEVPVLRGDGSICYESGYDDRCGVYVAPIIKPLRVPDNPTSVELKAAIALIEEAFCDFPFLREEHFSAAVSGLLTPFTRYAFDGPAPFHLVDANVRGAGKSILVDAMTIPSTGRKASRRPAPTEDEEWSKTITTILLAGDRTVNLDNIAGLFGSKHLDNLFTSTIWEARLLGGNKSTGQLTNYSTWYGSANNVTLKGDIARRTLHIRLESDQERPENRTGFRHHPLLPWVYENAAQLAQAALTILRNYYAAGCPDQRLVTGSFEEWGSVVRNAIVFAGLQDPLLTRDELIRNSDRGTMLLAELLSAWDDMEAAQTHMTVSQILGIINAFPDRHAALKEAFHELTHIKPGFPLDAVKIGNHLKAHKGRVVDGKRLVNEQTGKKAATWAVEHVEK